MMIVTALLSWIASRYIPKTGEGAPELAINRNILVSTGSLIKQLRADPRLWWGALVVSWFWLVGALILSLLPPLVTIDIGGTEGVITVFLTIFSVAVAVGSALAAWLAHGRIVLLPTLIAGVLLGLFSLDLGWTVSALVPAAPPLGIGDFFASRYSMAHRHRSCRARHCRRPCSWCRPLPRCRPGPAPTAAPAWLPASTCSTPRSWSSARSFRRCCRSSASAWR